MGALNTADSVERCLSSVLLNMIAVNEYTSAIFSFHIIEEVIMYGNDCYYLTKDTKQFLLILINHYVAILLI